MPGNLDVVVPVSGGEKIIYVVGVCVGYGSNRPEMSLVFSVPYHVVAWRIREAGAEPVTFPKLPLFCFDESHETICVIKTPSGDFLSLDGDAPFPSLEDAKNAVLLRAQNKWDTQRQRPQG